MHVNEEESALLKTYIIKSLENISDADSDVLADYVLALVKTDEPEPIARANCVENLKDFLGDNASKFVNDTFHAIATRSYDPSRPAPRPSAAVDEPPRQSNESRKRLLPEWGADVPQDGRIQSYEGGDRPVKQARRGGRGHEQQRGGRQAQQPLRQYGAPPPYASQTPAFQLPPMPTPPPGMPPFDPSNPMASIMAMQQLMGLPLPGMPGAGSPPASNGFIQPRSGQRCRDYDTKGFCARGISCPYEHGENPYIVPQQSDEYDPNNATMFPTPTRIGHLDTSPTDGGRGGARIRGRVGQPGNRGGGKRAEFSHTGRNHDRSITSVVVEQIPEDNFTEESVRDFFSKFGDIEEVTMQAYKRLAIVRYDSWDAAKAAYDSPKSVFDNRFVKVYWYKPETLPRPPNGHASSPAPARPSVDLETKQDEPEIDLEEVARRQEEAQRKQEETKKQREEALQRRQELDEKLKIMDQERKKMAKMLAAKTGGKPASPSPSANGAEDNEQTRALKVQLAKLEAEAKSMGIDPDAPASNGGFYGSPHGFSATSYRSRGGYRGRTPRGRGYSQASYRGGWAGAPAPRVKPSMSLDFRPKTVSVAFVDGGYDEHEEALRQYLMFNGLETAILTKHPARNDAALVAFQQRYEGENFMAAAEGAGPLAASDLPKQLGRVELAWHTGEKPAVTATNGHHASDDVKMDLAETIVEPQTLKQEREEDAPRDMDTYDDDMDRW
ncbi:hypothetical protein LTR36_007790 [Oleoguttula mirabilis]|uniref:Uncharacterized protein n=1 Tax=Oleoguttula mirabilis TaxID=1507867 RepID=A0AAV9JA72_9PEZI|nr:hypothetical protein LTR36_007790 [Oleoguttula mirabilis]